MLFPVSLLHQGEIKREDPLLVPTPGERPKGFKEVGTPADAKNPPTAQDKEKTLWTFRRNNPRSEFVFRIAPKPGGRPPLLDAAGRPVKQNLVLVARSDVFDRVKIYATRERYGPFFTPWLKMPKGSRGGYLQISGSRMTAAEARSLVANLEFVKTDRPATPTDGGDTKGGTTTGKGGGI